MRKAFQKIIPSTKVSVADKLRRNNAPVQAVPISISDSEEENEPVDFFRRPGSSVESSDKVVSHV